MFTPMVIRPLDVSSYCFISPAADVGTLGKWSKSLSIASLSFSTYCYEKGVCPSVCMTCALCKNRKSQSHKAYDQMIDLGSHAFHTGNDVNS